MSHVGILWTAPPGASAIRDSGFLKSGIKEGSAGRQASLTRGNDSTVGILVRRLLKDHGLDDS